MELTKVNNNYWIDGKEVDREVYNNALDEMNHKFMQFVEDRFTLEADADEDIDDQVDDSVGEDNEGEGHSCPLVQSLIEENDKLIQENESLRNALEEYEDSNFDVELAFNQLYDRLDKIEFMINHLNIPVTYQFTPPSMPNIDPKFWEITCNYNDPKIDEPCALATDPEAPKKRTRKSKNE